MRDWIDNPPRPRGRPKAVVELPSLDEVFAAQNKRVDNFFRNSTERVSRKRAQARKHLNGTWWLDSRGVKPAQVALDSPPRLSRSSEIRED